jgi:hypothetical protein
MTDGFWNLFSFTVAADGGITMGGQAQAANCQPPRLQDGNVRLASCRSNGCRVEVRSNQFFPPCIIVTLCSGAEREPVGHRLRRRLHRLFSNPYSLQALTCRCTDREAAVICRSLGASTGRQVQSFGGGSGPIWLDDVVCPVNYNGFIGNCGHLPWGQHNCGHHEDVGVCCS